MSYSAVVAGMNVRFATISGLTVLDYEPTTIEPPTIYTLLDSVTYDHRGQLKQTTYRMLHRLCLRWQDNERAEEELMPYVDSIPAAVKADPHLAGTLNMGLASIVEAQAVFVRIGNTTYRCLDFYSSVLVKE
jgi:hypothetical protein